MNALLVEAQFKREGVTFHLRRGLRGVPTGTLGQVINWWPTRCRVRWYDGSPDGTYSRAELAAATGLDESNIEGSMKIHWVDGSDQPHDAEADSTTMAELETYVRRIKNEVKHKYADALLRALKKTSDWEQATGQVNRPDGLSYMGAQAVRISFEHILKIGSWSEGMETTLGGGNMKELLERLTEVAGLLEGRAVAECETKKRGRKKLKHWSVTKTESSDLAERGPTVQVMGIEMSRTELDHEKMRLRQFEKAGIKFEPMALLRARRASPGKRARWAAVLADAGYGKLAKQVRSMEESAPRVLDWRLLETILSGAKHESTRIGPILRIMPEHGRPYEVTLGDFVRDNSGPDVIGAEELLAQVRDLKIGQQTAWGGGAEPFIEIERVR